MPKVFGWQHIVYLVIFVAAFAATLTVIKLKVKSERTLNIIIKSLGGLLLALIIFNRIAIAFHRHDAWGLVPDSFCGMTSLCLAICALVCKKDALPLPLSCIYRFLGRSYHHLLSRLYRAGFERNVPRNDFGTSSSRRCMLSCGASRGLRIRQTLA